MPNPWLIVITLLAMIGAGAGGYRMGLTVKEGEHALQRQSDIETAWKTGAADLANESARAQRAEQQRDDVARQLREIDRANPVPLRPDCRWTAVEYRLLESRRAAYAGDDPGFRTGALLDPVPRNADNRPGSTDDSQGSAGLGLGLQGAAASVPRLGGE